MTPGHPGFLLPALRKFVRRPRFSSAATSRSDPFFIVRFSFTEFLISGFWIHLTILASPYMDVNTAKMSRPLLLRSPLNGVTVLNRPSWLLTQCLLRLRRPIRFAQHFTGDKDQVCVASGHNLVGEMRFGNKPNGAGSNIGPFADAAAQKALGSLSQPESGRTGLFHPMKRR